MRRRRHGIRRRRFGRDGASRALVDGWPSSLLTLVVAFALTGCGELISPDPASPTLELVEFVDDLTVGDSTELRLAILANGIPVEGLRILWQSSDSSVATVRGLPATDTFPTVGPDRGSPTAMVHGLRVGRVRILVEVVGNGALAGTTSSLELRVSTRWVSISAGSQHACGVASTGEGYCWGSGLIGDGSGAGSSAPVPVVGSRDLVEISAGHRHSCALRVSRLMLCWGINDRGELGANNPFDQLTPVPVELGPRFRAFQAGHGYTCGVTDIDTGACWGDDRHGQLGSTDVDGTCGPDLDPCSRIPRTVKSRPGTDVPRFQSIAVGRDHTCAVDLEGGGWCWGDNTRGGLASHPLASSDTAVAIADGLTLSRISVGWWHSCALTTEGEAWCWGSNQFGELGGVGAPDSCEGTPCSREPIPVSGALRFREVSVGGRSTCASGVDGRAYCWGLNHRGQLGADATDLCDGEPCARSPIPVSSQVALVSLSVGERSVCALGSNGFAYCWGEGAGGKLGHGDEADAPRPRRIAEPSGSGG